MEFWIKRAVGSGELASARRRRFVYRAKNDRRVCGLAVGLHGLTIVRPFRVIWLMGATDV